MPASFGKAEGAEGSGAGRGSPRGGASAMLRRVGPKRYPGYSPRETSCAARRRRDSRKARDGDRPLAEEHKATLESRVLLGLWSSSPLNDSSQARQT